jgi:uncharacterized protein YndB with AHSA1/START domain
MPDSTAGATAARVEGRDLVLERTFDAPRALVFKAWTEPERLARWCSPHGWTMTVYEMEVRPGGVWRYCMRSDAGEESWGKGVYHEIVEPERIVYTDTFADAEGNPVPGAPEMLVSIALSESDGKTHVTLVTQFGSVAALESGLGMGMIKGWSETWDRLAEYLTQA